MKRIFVFILAILGLSSCFSIKSSYPQIDYYRLSPQETTITEKIEIHALLQVRDIVVTEDIDNDHFLALWDDTRMQRYFYHHWVSDLPSLVTDFIITRFGKMGAFTKGVTSSSSLIPPDYILDLRVLEMIAMNSKSEAPDANKVIITLQLSLFKQVHTEAMPILVKTEILQTEQYRPNNSAKTIAPAFSIAMSEICDKILLTMHKAIEKEKLNAKELLNNEEMLNNK